MSYAWAITFFFGLYFFGSIISYKTKGRIGTALVCLIVMLVGFNTGLLPRDSVTASNLAGMYALLNLTILINVGSSFDVKKLKNDWRLVVSVLAGIVGMGVMILGAGGILFGSELSMMSFPTLVGGTIATNLMTQAATEKGLVEMAAIVVLVQSVQGWVGLPLMTYGVRKECSRLLALYRETGTRVPANSKIKTITAQAAEEKPGILEKIVPKQCQNIFFYMFLACLFGALANVIAAFTSRLTGGIVGAALVGMFLGCVLTQLKILPKEPLVKAGLLNFFMFVLIVCMYGSLASLSMEALLASILPILGLVILGAIGMLALAIPIGMKLGFAPGMCISYGMGCYRGYPGNYQLGNEIIDILGETEEERQYLRDELLTRMVEGSVVSVSITSVVIAGIFVGLI